MLIGLDAEAVPRIDRSQSRVSDNDVAPQKTEYKHLVLRPNVEFMPFRFWQESVRHRNYQLPEHPSRALLC